MQVEHQRVYDFVKGERPQNTHVVLVDRLWPRDLTKQNLGDVEWLKHLAPSTDLRKWFGHEESRWKGFKKRYRSELHCCEDELERLRSIARKKRLILLYAARDTQHNQAVALEDFLEKGAKQNDT